ncbi:hypothetical protein CYMTET_45068 [Cymbomonas tetramitiformis]|uniref:Uncharacterized protein n=1 Tax=Cymbomonas tetramitiformis TaxID=36881 RepID=A0AAE0C084_9CHLO|nr:hypothetical protein CYMTET_45068 [Cymbomonas tetramitiformis]
MGAGASSAQTDPAYVVPVKRNDATLFLATPNNDNVKAKAPQVLIEISPHGFRLLRLKTEEPLWDFPFPQIHSWGHLPNKFSFRFYEERSKGIVLYSFETKLVDDLLQFIHTTIEHILSERKSKSMPDTEFNDLLQRIKESQPADRLEQLKTSSKLNYFTAAQGEQLVACLDGTFDKVEGAVTLHFCLVDQNHFSAVMRSLEDNADKENVLHRVAGEKQKKKSALSRNPSAA